MRKSLRLKIFGYIMLAVAFIFITNRVVSQKVTPYGLNERVNKNIASAMTACTAFTHDRDGFMQCVIKNSHDVIVGGLIHHYIFCLPKSNASDDLPMCDKVRLAINSNIQSVEFVSPFVVIVKQTIEGELLVVAKLMQDPSKGMILLRQDELNQYTQLLWSFRDRVILYVGPILVVCLAFLAWLCSSLIMGPIRQIEDSLKKLSSKNLDKPLEIVPVYKEFDSFISVFELLRIRLNESFVQARRFAGDASHELKTPLTILRGNAERIIAQLPTGSDEQVRMRSVADEVERLIEITEKLLLLSSADANIIQHDMREICISDVIGQLALDAQVFQSKLTITSDLQPKIFWLCDQNLINQLFYNLYSNAVKYNVDGGWVEIKLMKTAHGFELVMSNPTANPPEELAKRAFDRFYRGDSSRARNIDGIGLGLSLAQEIARVHGASLTLEVSFTNIVTVRLSYPDNAYSV